MKATVFYLREEDGYEVARERVTSKKVLQQYETVIELSPVNSTEEVWNALQRDSGGGHPPQLADGEIRPMSCGDVFLLGEEAYKVGRRGFKRCQHLDDTLMKVAARTECPFTTDF